MSYRILTGSCLDVLPTLPAESVHCCVTSPPYFGLRDYGADGQIGLESTPDEFVAALVQVFREVRRVLRGDGTLWLNLGDSFGPGKQLQGIPWRVAFALQADGWYLRSDIIWSKPNPMPESVTDRPTKAHEYLFLLTKQAKYYYDADAIREPNSELTVKVHGPGKYAASNGTSKPMDGLKGDRRDWNRSNPESGLRNGRELNGRNRRSVWHVATQPFSGAHFATFPPKLIEPCILAGCPKGGTVLDPFSGAGTTAMVAVQHGRNAIGIELNPEYVALSEDRLFKATEQTGLFASAA